MTTFGANPAAAGHAGTALWSHFRRIAIALGLGVGLLVLWLAFGSGTAESRNRKMAAELVALHRAWETNGNIPALFESLTNLPFHDHGGVLVAKGCVSRRYAVLGTKWEKYYFIIQSPAVTNASEWTLYRAWYWYRPGGGQKELATRKLVAIRTK
jgi:hypothetical protein